MDGLKDAVDALDAVAKAVKKKLLRKAATAGGKVVLRKYKDAVARRSGTLARSIGHKVKTYDGVAVDVIGARTGMTATVNGRVEDPSNIAHLVELGTRPHSTAKGSKLRRLRKDGTARNEESGQAGKLHPGARARPALIPAKVSSAKQVRDLMTAVIRDGIEAAAKGDS